MEKKFQLGINCFLYFVGDEKNIKIFNSNIEGKIIEIIYMDKLLEEQNIYINNDVFANIKPYNLL